VLPLTRLLPVQQGGQDGVRGPHAGADVGDGHAGPHRRGVLGARHAHDAAHGLGDGVVAGLVPVGTVLAEARDGAVDDAGIDLPQLLVTHAYLVGGAGPEVLQYHVGLPRQAVDDLPALFLLEVHGDAALVAVDAEEVGRLAADEGRAPGPGVVAGAGTLHLDDVGAQVRQHHEAVGPAQGS